MKAPECDKLHAVVQDSQKIGEFLGWLDEQGIVLARYGRYDELIPDHCSIERRLADYFDIDLDEVEREKRAILKAIAT